MRAIPQKLREELSKDPYYKTCARFEDGSCNGRITWEHAIEFGGKQLNKKWAIIPLCEYHHSVGKYQDIGGLNKERNVQIAINRATDEELIAVGRSTDYFTLRERLNKKYQEEKRTSQQNKAMHVYFRLVAGALNDGGLDIPEVIKHAKIDIPWTEESVKLLIWKTIQKSMFRKDSTTELSKQQEIDKIYEVVNRFLAKLKVESIPFPSLDRQIEEYESQRK